MQDAAAQCVHDGGVQRLRPAACAGATSKSISGRKLQLHFTAATMLPSTPFYATPPWQTFPSQLPPDMLKVVDWEQPSANGVDPGSEGWVYVKVDIYNGLCKVGYTDEHLRGRLIETGNPNLALHAAFSVPWGGNNWAHWAEQHCHNRLGQHRKVLHVMSGRQSEFFPGPVEHVTQQVAWAMQEFYDHLWHCVGWHVDVNAMRYDPPYKVEAVRAISDIRAPYWSGRFGVGTLHHRIGLPMPQQVGQPARWV